MKSIYIIGAGPGSLDLLTVYAQRLILESEYIIAHSRLADAYKNTGKTIFESSSPNEIADYISTLPNDKKISVLVSGDTGFYSLSKKLHKALEGMGSTEVVCGISSMQYFCSKIFSSWYDALLLSLHGRDINIVQAVKQNKKILLLTDSHNTPQRIIGLLCQNRLENALVTVGENLSYPNEKITVGNAKELEDSVFAPLSVMQIENSASQEHTFLSDEDFIRGNTPMTKQEVRLISISKLHLSKNDVVFDIGGGTGSVACEMALQIPEGKIFTIEKEEDAAELIEANKQKFGALNLQIIKGNAKDEILNLPAPNKVFIGGSGGEICDILDILYSKNPHVRIVLNAITLETLCSVTNYYKDKSEYLFEVINVSIAFAKKAGSYNILTGQNPVYIITVSRKD